MKFLSRIVILLILAATLSSCGETIVNPLGTFKVDIDGETLTATGIVGAMTKETSTESKIMAITGTSLEGDFVLLTFTQIMADLDTDCIAEGTYELGTTSPSTLTYTKANEAAQTVTSTVVISSCTADGEGKKISGTFSGSVEDMSGNVIELTNGVFEDVIFLVN